MAASFSIETKGLKELDFMLRKELPRRVGLNALSAAVSAGAAPVVRRAKYYAPYETGRLEANIYKFKIRSSQSSNSVSYAVSVRTRGKGDNADNAHYWTFQEFGTSRHPPHPFLRPALEAEAQNAVRIIRDKLAEKIVTGVVKAVR